MFLSTSFSTEISQKWFVDVVAIFYFSSRCQYNSQSYCRICDDTIFHYFAFANDLAFIYLWKNNNTTLL